MLAQRKQSRRGTIFETAKLKQGIDHQSRDGRSLSEKLDPVPTPRVAGGGMKGPEALAIVETEDEARMIRR
jgi:hypothetical protein